MIAARPPDATRVVLVRHGEAELEPGRICGRLDPPLAAEGRERIAALSRWLGGLELSAAFSSPARRAMETAALLAGPRGLRAETVDGLREVDFGALEGLTWDEAQARHPAVCAAWIASPHEVCFPGGESFTAVRSRAVDALRRVRERCPGGTLLVVAHAGVARAILGDALGVPGAAVFRIDQRPGAVNVVDWVEGVACVRLVNGGPALTSRASP